MGVHQTNSVHNQQNPEIKLQAVGSKEATRLTMRTAASNLISRNRDDEQNNVTIGPAGFQREIDHVAHCDGALTVVGKSYCERSCIKSSRHQLSVIRRSIKAINAGGASTSRTTSGLMLCQRGQPSQFTFIQICSNAGEPTTTQVN